MSNFISVKLWVLTSIFSRFILGLVRRAETSERDKLRMISTRLTESQIASMESSAKALGISKVDVIRMGIEWVASYVENIKA